MACCKCRVGLAIESIYNCVQWNHGEMVVRDMGGLSRDWGSRGSNNGGGGAMDVGG